MMHRRIRHGYETKYQTYRGKRRNEDYLIRAGAGGQEVHNGHFIIKKGSRRYRFRRHRRAYSVRAACGAPGNEVKENEEMTGTRARTRARGRGREEKKKRGGREQVDATARVENKRDTAARVAEGGQARPTTGLGAHINL